MDLTLMLDVTMSGWNECIAIVALPAILLSFFSLLSALIIFLIA